MKKGRVEAFQELLTLMEQYKRRISMSKDSEPHIMSLFM